MALFRKDQIPVFAVIALAVAAVSVMIWITGPYRSSFIDSDDYIAAARMILNDGTYPSVSSLPFFRAPLYPLFIAAIWSIFAESFVAIKIVQVVLHASSAWFIFRTAGLLTENRSIALIAGVLFAVNPYIAGNASAIQTETLQTFLMTLAILIMSRMLVSDKVSIRNAASLGSVFGLAALCKPSALGLCFVFAAVFLFFRFRTRNSIPTTATIIAAMFIVILPWSFYNLASKGEFILINDQSGWVLWAGNVPESLGIYEGQFNTALEAIDYQDHVSKTMVSEQIAEWERTVGYSALSFREREGLWRAKALELMIDNPGTTAKLFLWKFYLSWKPFINSDIYGKAPMFLSAIFGIPLFILGVLGILKMRKDRRTVPFIWLFAALAVFITAVQVVVIGGLRLRLPYVDPVLTIFAAVAVNALLVKIATRFRFFDLAKYFDNGQLLLARNA